MIPGRAVPAQTVTLIPRATYRVQFNCRFTFADATRLVPYLDRLGISHLYASPILKARPGSAHGYDIVDHAALNPELGSPDDFETLIQTLHHHGLGLLLDFVPNHMGIGGADNPWWLDVLEWGRASPFAEFFDIDWAPADPSLKGKVLLPFLGDHYGRTLEAGDLTLAFDAEGGAFSVWYYEHRFPIAIKDYPALLRTARANLPGGDEAETQADAADTLATLATEFGRIKVDKRTTREQGAARQAVNQLKSRLATAAAESPAIAQAIQALTDQLNGTPGDPRSFRKLHDLLEKQHYRPAYWRVATAEINYRRFFDINDLAGVRVEDPELFELSHQLIFRLIGEGKLQGLRLDHIDGLFDPAAYTRKLQDRAAYLLLQAQPQVTVGTESGSAPVQRRDHVFYLLVEKILAPHEHLPTDWPVDGTTGYDFLNTLTGLFVDPDAEDSLNATYQRFTGESRAFDAIAVAAKRQVIGANLASEFNVLTANLHNIARQSWKTRDFTLEGIRTVLTDLVAHFPVYRTYVAEDGVSASDRQELARAAKAAQAELVGRDTTPLDFILSVLSTDLKDDRGNGYKRADILRTAMKFQQFTGPVMAKAIEDTAFYRFHRLCALNEVGGEPARFCVSVDDFHKSNQDRQRQRPYGLLATATHDHKRGEDTRLRIAAISEFPDLWRRHVGRWERYNRSKKRNVDGRKAPSANAEYLIYQTLVGTWPLTDPTPEGSPDADYADRLCEYIIKALREAKQETSWNEPNLPYETATQTFVRSLLDGTKNSTFLEDFRSFHQPLATAAAVYGLSQLLLKLCAPGVPDFYQGTEAWDLSLVDPDNRRPVDFALRQTWLDQLATIKPKKLLDSWRDGRLKLFIQAVTLAVRRHLPPIFSVGDYMPLEIAGANADRVIGFVRRSGELHMVVVVPRQIAPLLADSSVPLPKPDSWGDTAVVKRAIVGRDVYRDVFTGRQHRVGDRWRVQDLFRDLPVALLLSPAALAVMAAADPDLAPRLGR